MDRRRHLKSQLCLLSSELEAIEAYLAFVLTREADVKDRSNHRHHILPKCLFPNASNFKKAPWNRSLLSPTDHIEAHRLLTLVFPECSDLAIVYNLMSRWKDPSRLKGTLRVHKEGTHRLIFWGELPKFQDLGWQLGSEKGRRWYNDGLVEFLIQPKDAGELTLGRLVANPDTSGRIRLTDGKETRCVPPEEVDYYLALGYSRGMLSVDRSHTKGAKVYNNGLVEIRIRDFSAERYPGFQPGPLPQHVQARTRSGYTCYTNGVKNIKVFPGDQIPKGFNLGRTHKTRARNSRPKKWYTNGVEQKQVFEGDEIPEGYLPGRLRK